jgi:hypothetical protein
VAICKIEGKKNAHDCHDLKRSEFETEKYVPSKTKLPFKPGGYWNKKKKPPWSESASELHRPRDRRLSAK